MMFKIALRIFFVFGLTSLLDVTMAMQIRLVTTNAEGTSGFVEVYYDGIWGFMGNPQHRFSDTTASVLCRILGKSTFGYGAVWTPINNATKYTWDNAVINCLGHETDAGQCERLGNWTKKDYSGETTWAYNYGSSLHCVESRLVGGYTPNSGVVESIFNGEVYQMCFEDFAMKIADVVCRNLGYEKAQSIAAAEQTTKVYSKALVCNGNESSVSKCGQQERNLPCNNVASVTCEAVRLVTFNGRPNEGIVEVFYNGTWGMVGNPGYQFDDVTASYLCKRFGLGNDGFGTQARYLGHHEGIAWTNSLTCHKNETNIMECAHDPFVIIPPLMYTYFAGSWLHCYPFIIDSVRLTNASEGRVELKINGQWGSICVSRMTAAPRRAVGILICLQLGYINIKTVSHDDNNGKKEDLFWMREVFCHNGNETNITDCSFKKGSATECYMHPEYLKISCK